MSSNAIFTIQIFIRPYVLTDTKPLLLCCDCSSSLTCKSFIYTFKISYNSFSVRISCNESYRCIYLRECCLSWEMPILDILMKVCGSNLIKLFLFCCSFTYCKSVIGCKEKKCISGISRRNFLLHDRQPREFSN